MGLITFGLPCKLHDSILYLLVSEPLCIESAGQRGTLIPVQRDTISSPR